MDEERIAGLSGVHDAPGFQRPHPALSLLGTVSNKDFACFNEEDVERALGLERADILLVHDWPHEVTHLGTLPDR